MEKEKTEVWEMERRRPADGLRDRLSGWEIPDQGL